MRDDLDIVETAGPGAQVHPPVLVILPDPEAKVDPTRPVLGRALVNRVAYAAQRQGFVAVLLAPGSRTRPAGAQELATGEPVGLPALLVYEGTVVDPRILALMVEHPLEDHEAFSLYDEFGRPSAWFCGLLPRMPSAMPVSEELPWPEDAGPSDIARVVYDEDLSRAEALVLRGEGVLFPDRSHWHRYVGRPTLRWLANARRPLARLELLAVGIALLALPAALLDAWIGLVGAALALVVGVHLASLMKAARSLRETGATPLPSDPGERLTRATRPLAHAAATAGLTWILVAETDRSGVAALVLLVAGAATVLLALFQARLHLHGRPADRFALPDARRFAERLGLALPRWLEGAPLLELAVLVTSLTGIVALPWSVLTGSAVARLWRWFSQPPPETAEPVSDAGQARGQVQGQVQG